MKDIALELAIAVAEVSENKNRFRQNLNQAKELYKKYLGTDQSNQDTINKNLKVILPPGIDLDKGEIYDIETGETIKEF
ncbi:hypothetical protein M4I33_10665 [Clostridium sp. LY3-2]|uniref:hypothetical protein n=1 Tax=Clostridium sp. LY3-2 TaxID=2942482 RepID=UPI002152F16C|nr:hypothetical protein [Clostridium sp. LY3-2]MCR6515329.1 hypothetical protein [Clostridium sp. LY3-2]